MATHVPGIVQQVSVVVRPTILKTVQWRIEMRIVIATANLSVGHMTSTSASAMGIALRARIWPLGWSRNKQNGGKNCIHGSVPAVFESS